jgi:hypothetical protein
MKKKTQSNPVHLMRRVLVPLFIVAVPIAAMIAFVMYYHRIAPQTAKEPTREVAVFGETNWPIGRGDAAMSGTAAGTLPGKLKPVWRFQTSDAIKGAPVVAEGVVFAGSMDKCLYAVNAENGKELWRFEADSALEAGALYNDGRVFIGSDNGTFYAIDAQTGKAVWTFEAGGQIAGAATIAMTDSGAVIVFGSYDNTLYGLEAKTGRPVFKHEAGNYINGSPAMAQGMAVFGACDGFVHCVPVGKPGQAAKIDAGSYVAAGPAALGSTVYVGSYEGVFLAADAAAGNVVWKYEHPDGEAFFSSAAVNERYVIAGAGTISCTPLSGRRGRLPGGWKAGTTLTAARAAAATRSPSAITTAGCILSNWPAAKKCSATRWAVR